MNEIAYVSEEHKQLAVEIEKTFCELPETVGIIFASVSANPEVKGESKSITVVLGLQSSLNYDIGAAIIQQVVSDEFKKRKITEMLVEMSVHVGTAGKYIGKHSEKANPSKKA